MTDTILGNSRRVAARISLMAADATRQSNQRPTLVREPVVRIDMLGGIGATTLRRMIVEQGFPAPIELSPRIRAWNLAAVETWIATRENKAAAARKVGGAA